MKKHIIFIIIIILFIAIPIVWAQEETIISCGKWDAVENSSGLTLTAYHEDGEEEVNIPEILDGKPVTALGKELFKNNYSLRTVFIPDSVTTIGANVFNGCVSLEEVRLPEKLKKIDSGTFRYCFHLENIFIPFTVTTINGSAFADCVNLKEVNLISVTSIGESAFDNCQSLRTVTVSRKLNNISGYAFRDTPWLDAQKDEYVIIGDGILVKYNGSAKLVNVPAGVTQISGAFEGNQNLKDVFLPDTLKKIGQYSFRNAVNLRHITIPEFLTAIDNNAFDGCLNLAEIDIPYRVSTIGNNAFRGCETLQNVVLPAQLKRINNGSFSNCTALKQLLIPAAVTDIHQNAFSGTDDLTLMVAYGSAGEQFAKENGIKFSYDIRQTDSFLYTKDQDGIHILRYIGKFNDVQVPAEIEETTVVEISSGAFQLNSHVHSVSIPLGAKTIGSWAFSYMSSLESVELPVSLTAIGANAFTGCSSLKELTLPDHLKEIGENAFGNGAQTALHTGEGSATEKLLQTLGLEAAPAVTLISSGNEEIAAVQKLIAYVIPSEDAAGHSEAASPEAESAAAESVMDEISDLAYVDYQIISIPDETTVLSTELLNNAEKNLILIVPATVTDIDEKILDGRNVIIVGKTGSTAESFAMEHDLIFMVRFKGISSEIS